MTCSAVSRILTEARDKGLVGINVRRPLRFDDGLSPARLEADVLSRSHGYHGDPHEPQTHVSQPI